MQPLPSNFAEKERLRFWARKLKEHQMQFTHTPRPAVVPESAASVGQRWFGAGREDAHGLPLGDRSKASVYRWAGNTIAHISFATEIGGLQFPATPDQLRELARRLIDAAHDIEANP